MWNKIPEVIRWVICWPAIFIPTVLAGTVFPFFWGLWINKHTLSDSSFGPFLGALQILFIIWLTLWALFSLTLLFVPRRQEIFARIFSTIFISIGVIFALINVIGFFYKPDMTILIVQLVTSLFLVATSLFWSRAISKAVQQNTRYISVYDSLYEYIQPKIEKALQE